MYKNFKKNIIVFFVSIFVFMIVILFTNYFFYKVPLSVLWIDKVYQKKEDYAKSITNPKLVVTGGSGVLFSVETHYLENRLGIPTVNMGVNAGLKTDYILYRTKKVLNSKDIVLVILEYPNLVWDGEQSIVRTDYVLTYDKDFFLFYMDFLDKFIMLNSVTNPSKYVRVVKQYRKKLKESSNADVYNSKTININGDETFKNAKNKILDINSFTPFTLPNKIETKGILSLLEFNRWCQDNNISILVSFPSTLPHKEYFTKDYQEYFKKILQYLAKHNIKVIGTPNDFFYPVNYFYDTNYHLNSKGAVINTKKLEKILKKDKIIETLLNNI